MAEEKRLLRFVKVIGITAAVLVGLLIAALLLAIIVYPPAYVYRVLVWQESDNDDYRYNFPKKPLVATSPAPFPEAYQMEEVAAVFEQQEGIADLEQFLAGNDTQAFLVLQDSAIIYEGYFNGTDRETPVTSYSVAKSWTSALIGKALQEGYIESVDEPITNYLPELAERDLRFQDITIRHLLMMASGLAYQEMRPLLFNGDDPLTTYYTDQRELALKNTTIHDAPGTYWLYNKYHPQLLGLILERATGVSVTEYMQRTFWEPLGMAYDGWWSLDSEESGFEKMEAGLNGPARDFAKFGQLFLQEGEWNGEQVLPQSWVQESTDVDTATQNETYYAHAWGPDVYDDGHGYYKYMWYGFFRDGNGAGDAGGYDFAALGDHGQIIYVAPSKNLVIVRHGTSYGDLGKDWAWTDMLYQFVSDWEE